MNYIHAKDRCILRRWIKTKDSCINLNFLLTIVNNPNESTLSIVILKPVNLLMSITEVSYNAPFHFHKILTLENSLTYLLLNSSVSTNHHHLNSKVKCVDLKIHFIA